MKNWIHSRCLVPLLFLVIFGANFYLQHNRDLFEIDEAAWIFSTYFYDLAFVKHDFSNPEWKGYDALDHPPMAKYLFGFFLSLGNADIKNPEFKKWWHARDDDFFVWIYQFLLETRDKLSKKALVLGRLLSMLSFLGVTLLVLFFGKKIFSAQVGFFASLLFALSPMVLLTSVQCVADGIFLFFLVGTVALQAMLVQRMNHHQNPLLFSLLLGLCLAFLFLTKLTGLIAVGITGLIFLAMMRKHPNKRTVGVAFLVTLSTFVIAAVLLNPSFYSNLFGFLRMMFMHRMERMQLQMNIGYWLAIPTISLRLSVFLKKVFFEGDLFFQRTAIPVYLIFFVVGILRLIEEYRRKKDFVFILLINFFIWVGSVILLYSLNWPRYLLPTYPFIFMVMGLGINEIVGRFKNIAFSVISLKSKLLWGMLLGAIIFSFQRYYTVERWALSHPEWYEQAEAIRLKTYLQME